MHAEVDNYRRELVEAARSFAEAKLSGDANALQSGVKFREYFRLLADQGWAGIFLPTSDGGQGGSLLDAVLVIEAVARVSPLGGDAIQALNFGAIQQVARLGSDDLKERYLKPCLQGTSVISVSMTEPDAGSSVTDLATSAKASGDSVILNGQKIFTTHGAHADYFVVWVKFGPDRESAGAVLVERDTPGLTVDASHVFMSGEHYGILYLDQARVSASNILVDHDGFHRLLAVFNIERLGNATRSLALGQAAFDLAVAHLKDRRQFGRRLAEFQGLQWRIAEIKVQLEAARLLLYAAASNVDVGLPSALDTSMAKLACNRAGFNAANEALQIFGAYGYDNEAVVNYLFRRTRGWMIAGGTIEQMLNRIAAEVIGERLPQRSNHS